MTQDGKSDVVAEEDRQDRMSYLPINIIDGILELLPVEDAARTCILSKQWRYTWAMLPSLILNNEFCSKLAKRSQSNFKDTVDKILSQHRGNIVKFVLDVSTVDLSSDIDIDRWLLIIIAMNGIKKLILRLNKTNSIPSYIFNCSTLTQLHLINCVLNPPISELSFPNLRGLLLNQVTFLLTSEFLVFKAPILVYLVISCCDGTEYLNIVSPHLVILSFAKNHPLLLNCFTNCKKIRVLSLESNVAVKRSTLQKLLSLPVLNMLQLGPLILESLSADDHLKGLCFTLNCAVLKLFINFHKVGEVSSALELIKRSPNMSKLVIWVYGVSGCAEAVLDYLNSPACLNQPFNNKLNHVVIHFFKGSEAEVLFVKLLLARTPSLVSMSIDPGKAFSGDESSIKSSLMSFSRASTEAELFYLAKADWDQLWNEIRREYKWYITRKYS